MQAIAEPTRRLDEVNVDDVELEDELEPLYAHGNKMDSGPFGTGMSGGPVPVVDRSYPPRSGRSRACRA